MLHEPRVEISWYNTLCMISDDDIQQHSRSTEPVQTDTECSTSEDDQALMADDGDRATDKLLTDDATPQHKLSSNDLDDIVNTRLPTTLNSSLPISRNFQERKVLFIEQARRFVKYLVITIVTNFFVLQKILTETQH